MAKPRSLQVLAIVFFLSGLYDALGGIYFLSQVGTGKSVSQPPIDPFYAHFIATFLISFAVLQFLAAWNIKRYLIAICPVIIGRLWYVGLLGAYVFGVPGFPRTFVPTAIMDLVWSGLYLALIAVSDEVRLKDLLVPVRGGS